jgi:ABC-type sugar transport system ATPase subunit
MQPSASLVATGITKSYGANVVLNSVTVQLIPGTITALVGHNGAGKSTLLRCLSGADRPDSGEILLGGEPVRFSSPADAKEIGLACVYQELSLVDCLTVSQNVFLGSELLKHGRLDMRVMDEATRALCEEFGIRVNPGDTVSRLPVAQRQLIEVAAAIRRETRYLLLDEPTTALEPDQIEHLLSTVKTLAATRNLAVLLVDHKLDEVFAVADHVICLADGTVVLDRPMKGLKRSEVVAAIVGEEGAHEVPERKVRENSQSVAARAAAVPRLEVRDLSAPRLAGVSLDVHAGEILGIYGLVGSGRSRFLRTLYGDEPFTAGEILLDGAPVTLSSVGRAMEAGIAYLPEERKLSGFIPIFDSLDNVVLPVLKRFTRLGLIDRASARRAGRTELQGVSVRGSLERPMVELSGGNQQKVLFGRAALQSPRVLLLDEPTKGVDIGAKAELHDIIRRLAHEEDVAVIVVSSEEEELLAIADSICVFTSGACDGTRYSPDEIGAGNLRSLAWGDSPRLVGASTSGSKDAQDS